MAINIKNYIAKNVELGNGLIIALEGKDERFFNYELRNLEFTLILKDILSFITLINYLI